MKPLTDAMIDSGKRFVALLIGSDSTPKAAFWIYNPQEDRWMLLLGHINGIEDDDDKFDQLINIIYVSNQAILPELTIADIGHAKSNAPILELLDSVVNTGEETLGINFSNEEINGTIIDGVYLYRMNITELV